jgi:hypothetical protein
MDVKGLLLASAALCMITGLPISAAQATDSSADSREVDSRLDTLFGSHEAVKEFLTSLKEDSANKRWPAIADMITYPIKIRLGRHRIRIHDPAEFIAHSEAVLTPKVVAAIAQQTYATLFANDRGVMIGSGEVWFSPLCADADCKNAPIKIIAINP